MSALPPASSPAGPPERRSPVSRRPGGGSSPAAAPSAAQAPRPGRALFPGRRRSCTGARRRRLAGCLAALPGTERRRPGSAAVAGGSARPASPRGAAGGLPAAWPLASLALLGSPAGGTATGPGIVRPGGGVGCVGMGGLLGDRRLCAGAAGRRPPAGLGLRGAPSGAASAALGARPGSRGPGAASAWKRCLVGRGDSGPKQGLLRAVAAVSLGFWQVYCLAILPFLPP